MSEIKIGEIYQHYKKKNFYKISALGKHTETLEDMVVYESQYENPISKVWIRPLSMFTELVDSPDGTGKVPRFKLVQ